MVSVIINWLYIAFTTLFIGHFCLKRAYRFAGYEGEIRVSASIAAGLALTTVYAGYFSIIYKVGVLANIIMIICCAVFVWLDKEDYSYLLKQYTTDCMTSLNTPAAKVKVVFAIIIFVSVLYYTTDGQFFSDSGYYHEQSIRWIEEFGTVKGSVHILKRLAYNSHYFCQCALYSMRDVFGGQSLHCLGGFYALFVSLFALFGMDGHVKTNVIRLAPIIYFIMFCSEITSPASDYPLTFAVMYVSIRWFELRNQKEENYVPYALLTIFIVYIVSIKLTVGCLILLVVKPAIDMIKGKKIKEIISCFAAGVIFILPYFIRNYLICGWLIYPFTKIDLFNPKWKLVAEAVQSDADEIKVWGRGMGQLGGQATDGISVWLPHWWDYLSDPDKLMVTSILIIMGVYAIFRIVTALITVLMKKDLFVYDNLYKYLFELTILASLLYWFIESPLFRYGLVYNLIALTYMLGDMLGFLFEKINRSVTLEKRACKLGLIAMTIAILLPLWSSLYEYVHRDYEVARFYNDNTHYVMQKDYPRVEYGETEIEGNTFYYPKDELGQIGYHIFPALWLNGTDGIKLLGDSIEDGFYSVNQ